MKKIFMKIILFTSIFMGLLIISNTSNASEGLILKKLSYDVQLNSDGTADVTENWKISIEDTNTLFKTFKIDTSKYKEITNVKVSEVKTNGEVNFTKINQYQYHVDKNCYYAMIYKGKFEIAWGAHAEDTTKNYKISYKVIDAVKNYNDCSEFYWQFISTESEIPAKYIEGTIRLPSSVQEKENLRTWAHGPLNGNIQITSNDTIKFDVSNFNKNTMLEVRVVTPTNIFMENQNMSSQSKLNNILTQEQNWADEANAKREAMQKRAKIIETVAIIVVITTNIIGAILASKIIKKIKNYKDILNKTPKIKPTEEYEYFRDIPDEKETPAEVGFIYYFKTTGLQYNMPKIMSATMLDLCMKKYIEFEVIPNKKNQVKVTLKKSSSEGLKKDEKIIYELIQKIPQGAEQSFTMKEFEKYVANHSGVVQNLFKRLEEIAKDEQEENENYSKELIEKSTNWTIKGVGYIFLTIVSLFIMWLLLIPAIIASVYCFRLSARYNTLTQKGIDEKEKLIKLKKYMEEFSMIKDRTVPELVLWEKYLIYATIFGIAEKVLKQLKIVYPQLLDNNYITSNEYTYLYLMYSPSFTNSFINSLNTSIVTSYSSMTNHSSGSGYGGGFSSGGGFGRRRRPEWAVDSK